MSHVSLECAACYTNISLPHYNTLYAFLSKISNHYFIPKYLQNQLEQKDETKKEGNLMQNNLKRKISFSPPDISELEIREVVDVLRSGWLTTGPKTKQLEKELARYVGAEFPQNSTPFCVCLNSQTACQELVLRIMGIGEGDEVIVPAYNYTASASVVHHVGAKIIFVDSQKDCIEMDYDALENAITEHTKVIIPVDLGGVPCDYQKIFDIVERKKSCFKPSNDIQNSLGRIAIMADAAHALGTTYKKQMIGTIADFSCFSFHAVKT